MSAAVVDRVCAHDLLLRLAGRVPDNGLAMLRGHLADRRDADLVAMLSRTFATGKLALLAAEEAAARAVLGRAPDAELAPRLNTLDAPPFVFSHDEDAAGVAARAAALAREAAGLRALWCVTRRMGDRAAVVLLGETAAGTDNAAVTDRFQRLLADMGEVPRAEFFGEDTELPPYHEAALLGARLVWQAAELPPVRVARLYDADPDSGQGFVDDHPSVPAEDRSTVAEFLRSGELVLAAFDMLPDVVRPENGDCVPAGYRSDGVWIWCEATGYYLDRYGLAPDPDLMAHALRAASPRIPLSRLTFHRVLAALGTAEE